MTDEPVPPDEPQGSDPFQVGDGREDRARETVKPIVEHTNPEASFSPVVIRDPVEETRRWLAYGAGAVTAVIAMGVLVALCFGVNWDSLKDYLGLVFTPVITLTAGLFGFYANRR